MFCRCSIIGAVFWKSKIFKNNKKYLLWNWVSCCKIGTSVTSLTVTGRCSRRGSKRAARWEIFVLEMLYHVCCFLKSEICKKNAKNLKQKNDFERSLFPYLLTLRIFEFFSSNVIFLTPRVILYSSTYLEI